MISMMMLWNQNNKSTHVQNNHTAASCSVELRMENTVSLSVSLQRSPAPTPCSTAPACRPASAVAPPSPSRSAVGRSVRRAACALRAPSTTTGRTPVCTGKSEKYKSTNQQNSNTRREIITAFLEHQIIFNSMTSLSLSSSCIWAPPALPAAVLRTVKRLTGWSRSTTSQSSQSDICICSEV